MTNIKELKLHTERLKNLLDDPHPGLASWIKMYEAEMKWIYNFWNEGEDVQPATASNPVEAAYWEWAKGKENDKFSPYTLWREGYAAGQRAAVLPTPSAQVEANSVARPTEFKLSLTPQEREEIQRLLNWQQSSRDCAMVFGPTSPTPPPSSPYQPSEQEVEAVADKILSEVLFHEPRDIAHWHLIQLQSHREKDGERIVEIELEIVRLNNNCTSLSKELLRVIDAAKSDAVIPVSPLCGEPWKENTNLSCNLPKGHKEAHHFATSNCPIPVMGFPITLKGDKNFQVRSLANTMGFSRTSRLELAAKIVDQLTTANATINRMREALQSIITYCDGDIMYNAIDIRNLYSMAKQALATQPSAPSDEGKPTREQQLEAALRNVVNITKEYKAAVNMLMEDVLCSEFHDQHVAKRLKLQSALAAAEQLLK